MVLSLLEDEDEDEADVEDESLVAPLSAWACINAACNNALIIWNAVARSVALTVEEEAEEDEEDEEEEDDDDVEDEDVDDAESVASAP